jgi:hypothetical protein
MSFDTKTFEDGHPVFWLRNQFLAAKNIPEPVKDHIKRLFDKQDRYPDQDTAEAECQRLMCRIHQARTQYALLNMEPSDRRFFSLSKSAATWLTLAAKFNKVKRSASGTAKSKKTVPIAALTPVEDDDSRQPEPDTLNPGEDES